MKKQLILMALLLGTAAYAQKTKNNIDPKIDAYVKKEMKATGIPGMAVAVIRDGKILHSQSYGTANIEHDIPVSAGTSFQIASVTKLFTSTLIAKWLQEKKISLDDQLSKYIADSPESWKAITLRQLLAHESGIPWAPATAGSNGARPVRPFVIDSLKSLVEKLKTMPLKFAPGSSQLYINGDYFLIQYLIEKLADMPFEQVLKKEVFEPLGMERSGFDGELRDLRMMTMYPLKGKSQNFTSGTSGPLIFKGYFAPTTYDAGGLYLSLADATKWVQALDAQQFLRPATLELFQQLRDPKDGFTQLGWTSRHSGAHQVIGHSGGPGLADILRVPSQKLTIIVLNNFLDVNPYIAGEILQHYLPEYQPQQLEKKIQRDFVR